MAVFDPKLLTFSLANEEYGMSIVMVKELIGMMHITPVPKTPEYMKGVINLRGKIIPVIDLRLKFGMEPQEYTERTCIIVIEAYLKDGMRTMGVIVDNVSEVVSISPDTIDPPPEYGSSVDASSILGIAKIEESVVIILDIEKLFNFEEVI